MRRFRLALALLLASCSTAGSIAVACDHCRNHQGCKCSCKPDCEDRGLLGAVDRFAGNLQAGIKKSLPKIELNAKFELLGRGRDCDSGEDTCGCEMKPATASCDCETHPYHHPAPAPLLGTLPRSSPIPESVQTPPRPILSHAPEFGPGHVTTPVPPKPLANPFQPTTRPVDEEPSMPDPNPLQRIEDIVPDAVVDPFQDDATASINRYPQARPVTYQRQINRYVDSYDPQANSVYRVKIIDTGSDVERAVATVSSPVTTASAAVPAAVGPGGVSSRRVPNSQPTSTGSTQVRPGALQHAGSTDAPRPISSRPAASGGAANYYGSSVR